MLLAIATVALVVQLLFPSISRWWNQPTPGQIGIDNLYASQEEQIDLAIDCLAPSYVTYLPPRYGKDGVLPLLVYLHGAGARGNDVSRLMKGVIFNAIQSGLEMPAVVVSPQCLPDCSWHPDETKKFIAEIGKKYAVDHNRVYLMGYSMGAYGTWATAAEHAEIFAAIVPIAGAGDPTMASSLASMPIWCFHGVKDETVPVEGSTSLVEAIRAAGGAPNITLYPELGHLSHTAAVQDPELWKWLFEQRLEDGRLAAFTEASTDNEN